MGEVMEYKNIKWTEWCSYISQEQENFYPPFEDKAKYHNNITNGNQKSKSVDNLVIIQIAS